MLGSVTHKSFINKNENTFVSGGNNLKSCSGINNNDNIVSRKISNENNSSLNIKDLFGGKNNSSSNSNNNNINGVSNMNFCKNLINKKNAENASTLLMEPKVILVNPIQKYE